LNKALLTASPIPAELANEPAVQLLLELLGKPSITPDDAGCQSLLADRLAAAGLHCESMPFGDVSNLWARIGTEGPLLCFAGHTDVVPPGNLSEWETDPFTPVYRDGHLYARGAADMKAGLAAMVVAAEQFLAAWPDFEGSLAFLITSDEEGRARDGTLKVIEALSERGERIDWCVIGEPSSDRQLGDVIRIGRRGSLSGMLTVSGVQGHVAYPQLADNPIARFAPVLAALHDTEWDHGNEHFPPTSFQVVHLEAGVGAPNVTPPSLYARFNFRYSTEWDHESLKARVLSLFQSFDFRYELNWHLSGEPFLTEPGVLTDAASQAIEEISGRRPDYSTGGGTSDGRFISPAGADVIELGPVNASIHKVNEHVLLADVPRLTVMYRRIMEILLG
jgi:succinyl-diaminopimelate desuccinylase